MSKSLTKAIKLKNEISENRSDYRYYWVFGGQEYNSGSMDINKDENGDAVICTFPGLERTTLDNHGARSFVTIVKAKVILNSAFTFDED